MEHVESDTPNTPKRIFITGGHLTPALAVIDELQKKHKSQALLFFVGREFAQTYPPQPSHEQVEMEKRGIPFFPIQAAKVHRQQFWLNVFEVVKFPLSFWEVYRMFAHHKPDVVLSFGGYVAFPVCVMGKVFGARVITHEQTHVAGLANQVIAYLADTIALANEESKKYFPEQKTVVTGNPIRESLLREYKTPPSWFPETVRHLPFIYVTGGSQGSQVINQTIAQLLQKLVNEYVVIHQCGATSGHEYLQELERQRLSLPEELQERYVVREWIEAREVSYLIRNAKFVISRSGANTVEEITLSGTPAIFIPLSFAYNNEQQKNAEALVEAGSALMLLQKDLIPETLWSMIQTMERKYDKLKGKAEHLAKTAITNGTQRLIALLFREEK